MIYGIDYLGGAKYPEVILKEHPAGWAAGFFWSEFGDASRIVDALAKTGRCPHIRIQLIWDGGHNYGDRHIAEIKKQSARVNALAQKYKNIRFEISPFCEHNIGAPDRYLYICQASAPSCGVVNTPWRGGVSGKYKNEFHGVGARPDGQTAYNFSYDGSNCVDADIETDKRRMGGAQVFFLWNCQANGKRKQDDKTPISARRAWPTSRQIDSWIYLATHSKGQTSIPKGWIYKSHSDQNHDIPQGREQHPVFVKIPKFGKLELRAANGQVVAVGQNDGPSELGGYRSYLPDWGYLLADKAIRIQGNAVCQVFLDGKKVGLIINPAFRDGSYR